MPNNFSIQSDTIYLMQVHSYNFFYLQQKLYMKCFQIILNPL